MKKVILLLVLSVGLMSAAAQDRENVLIEVSGSRGCDFCPTALDAAKTVDGETAFWIYPKGYLVVVTDYRILKILNY